MPEIEFSDLPIDLVIEKVSNTDRQGQQLALKSFIDHPILQYYLQDYSLEDLKLKMVHDKANYSELNWFIIYKSLLHLSYFKELSIDPSDAIKTMTLFDQLLLHSYLDDDGDLLINWHKQYPNILKEKIVKFDPTKEIFVVSYDLKYTQMIHQSKYLKTKVQPYVLSIRRINKIAIQLLQMVEQYAELADLIPQYFHSFLSQVEAFEIQLNSFLIISWGDLLIKDSIDQVSDKYHLLESMISSFSLLRNEINVIHNMVSSDINNILSLSRLDLINHSDQWKSIIDTISTQHVQHVEYNSHLNQQLFKILQLTIECMSLPRWLIIPVDISDCFTEDYKSLKFSVVCSLRATVYKIIKKLYNIPLHFKGIQQQTRHIIHPNQSIYKLIESEFNFLIHYLPVLHTNISNKLASNDYTPMDQYQIGIFLFDFNPFNEFLKYLNSQYLQQQAIIIQNTINTVITNMEVVLELINNNQLATFLDLQILQNVIKYHQQHHFNNLLEQSLLYKVNIRHLKSLFLKLDPHMPLLLNTRDTFIGKQKELITNDLVLVLDQLESPLYSNMTTFQYSLSDIQAALSTTKSNISKIQFYLEAYPELNQEYVVSSKIDNAILQASQLQQWLQNTPDYFELQTAMHSPFILNRDLYMPLLTNIRNKSTFNGLFFVDVINKLIKIIQLVRFDIYTDFSYVLNLLKINKSHLQVSLYDLLGCPIHAISNELIKINDQAILDAKISKLVNHCKSIHHETITSHLPVPIHNNIVYGPFNNINTLLNKVIETTNELLMILDASTSAATKLTINEIASECDIMKSQLLGIHKLELKWIETRTIVYTSQTTINKGVFQLLDKQCLQLLSGISSMTLIALVHSDLETTVLLDQLRLVELEIIQFLHLKRQQFQRFYFLSNEELLHLLSNGHDMVILNKFMHKFITGCSALIVKDGWITGISNSNEILQLVDHVQLQPVELLLPSLINQCKFTLSNQLVNTPECTQMKIVHAMITFTKHCELCITTKKLNNLKIVTCHLFMDQLQQFIISDVQLNKPTLITEISWTKYIRYYMVDDLCVIKHYNTSIPYGYEYLGDFDHLVMTPQIWDCMHMTLLGYSIGYGPNPSGPAGTGKTETMKYLGALLGKQVVVFNCDDTISIGDFRNIYMGMISSQQWGCFDEFNRMNTQVMGLISKDVSLVLNAQRQGVKMIKYMDVDVAVPPTVTAITMNPVSKLYGGRNTLPSVIRDLFKLIQMDYSSMVTILQFIHPHNDLPLLLEVCKSLKLMLHVNKINDFTLRTLKPICMTKPVDLFSALYTVMYYRMHPNDLNIVNKLFNLFHPLVAPLKDPVDAIIQQTNQLFHNKTGVCYLGAINTGKSTILAQFINQSKLVAYYINPKSILPHVFTGYMNMTTNEWIPGILSKLCQQNNSLIVFDGPIDPEWVELLNSCMDDNKLLTLPNGQRIQLINIKFLFLSHDLHFASPATTSRLGFITFNTVYNRIYTNEIKMYLGHLETPHSNLIFQLHLSTSSSISNIHQFINKHMLHSTHILHIYAPESTIIDKYGCNPILQLFHFISKYKYYYTDTGELVQFNNTIVLYCDTKPLGNYSRFHIIDNKAPLYKPQQPLVEFVGDLPFELQPYSQVLQSLISKYNAVYYIPNALLGCLPIIASHLKYQLLPVQDTLAHIEPSVTSIQPILITFTNMQLVSQLLINHVINPNLILMPIVTNKSLLTMFMRSSIKIQTYHTVLINDNVDIHATNGQLLFNTNMKQLIKRQIFINNGITLINTMTNNSISLKLDIKLNLELIQQNSELALQSMTVLTKRVTDMTLMKSNMDGLIATMSNEQETVILKKQQINAELSLVQPVLDIAKQSINNINNQHLTELKSLRIPPVIVERVIEGVFIILGINDTSWLSMKGFLGDKKIKEQLLGFDPNMVSNGVLNKLTKYLNENPLDPTQVYKSSQAAAPLAEWVIATKSYCDVLATVKPLHTELNGLTRDLEMKQEQINKLQLDASGIQGQVELATKEFQTKTQLVEKMKLECELKQGQLRELTDLIGEFTVTSTHWKGQLINMTEQDALNACIFEMKQAMIGQFKIKFTVNQMMEYQQQGLQDVNYMQYAYYIEYSSQGSVIIGDTGGIFINYYKRKYSGAVVLTNRQIGLIKTAVHLNQMILLVMESETGYLSILDLLVNYEKCLIFVSEAPGLVPFVEVIKGYKMTIYCEYSTIGVQNMIDFNIMKHLYGVELEEMNGLIKKQIKIQHGLEEKESLLLELVGTRDVFHMDIKQTLIEISELKGELGNVVNEIAVLKNKLVVGLDCGVYAVIFMKLHDLKQINPNYGIPLNDYIQLIINNNSSDALMHLVYNYAYYTVFEEHRHDFNKCFTLSFVTPPLIIPNSGLIMRNKLANVHKSDYKLMTLSELPSTPLMVLSGKLLLKECHMDPQLALQYFNKYKDSDTVSLLLEYEPLDVFVGGLCTFVDIPHDFNLLLLSMVQQYQQYCTAHNGYKVILIHCILIYRSQFSPMASKIDYEFNNTDIGMALGLVSDKVNMTVNDVCYLIGMSYCAKVQDEMDILIIHNLIKYVVTNNKLKVFDTVDECVVFSKQIGQEIARFEHDLYKIEPKLDLTTTSTLNINNLVQVDKKDDVLLTYLKYTLQEIHGMAGYVKTVEQYVEMIHMHNKGKLKKLEVGYKIGGLLEAFKWFTLDKEKDKSGFVVMLTDLEPKGKLWMGLGCGLMGGSIEKGTLKGIIEKSKEYYIYVDKQPKESEKNRISVIQDGELVYTLFVKDSEVEYHRVSIIV